MSVYLYLFIAFFKVGLISFGGGYAMIPVIQKEVEAHQWLTAAQFNEVISVSAMAPGPIAANSAAMTGYEISGLPGAAVACAAIVLPSFLLILAVMKFFGKFHDHPVVASVFYGLRPVIAGIIFYAAAKFAFGNGIIGGEHGIDYKSLIVMAASFVLLLRTRINPVIIIIASGIAGAILYS